MPLKRFALYFLSLSVCAVALFPRTVAAVSVPPAVPAFVGLEPLPPLPPGEFVRPAALKKSPFHHRRLAPT